MSAFYRHPAELNKFSVHRHTALDLIQFPGGGLSRTDLAVNPKLIGMGVTKINAVVHTTFEQENNHILEFREVIYPPARYIKRRGGGHQFDINVSLKSPIIEYFRINIHKEKK